MKATPKAHARLAGALYLVIMVAALFSEIVVRGALIDNSDAAATARNILANEKLYRFGGILDIITYCCDIAVAGLLYQLTSPIGSHLASVTAFFRLAYAAMAGILCFYWFGAIGILGSSSLGGLSLDQQQALALSQLDLRNTGFVVALVFFGIHLMLLGALFIKALYFPTWLGILLVMAGACYVANSVTILALPTVSLGIWLLLPGFFSEKLLTLWLLIFGLKEEMWRSQPMAQI